MAKKDLEKLLEKEKRETPLFEEDVDKAAVSKIVKRMKKRRVEAGVEEKELPERAAAIREMIEAGPTMRLGEGRASELVLFESKSVRFFGRVYNGLGILIRGFQHIFPASVRLKLSKDLAAARMRYSVEQYTALTLAVTALLETLVLLVMLSFYFLFTINPAFMILPLVFLPVLSIGFALILPGSQANKIANEIDKDLPFALRHMSIEIKAGVGIYKTMESIAATDYGKVSEGFRYVLDQIDKGMPTEEALENWAENTKSEGLRRAISHMVRALRTGGNLSDIMVTIAEDVSFERRAKIADFAEKLNLLALFLMMATIVFPVMLTILTSIGASPAISQYMALFSLFTPSFLALFYFMIVPAMLFIFIYFIRASDPGA